MADAADLAAKQQEQLIGLGATHTRQNLNGPDLCMHCDKSNDNKPYGVCYACKDDMSGDK